MRWGCWGLGGKGAKKGGVSRRSGGGGKRQGGGWRSRSTLAQRGRGEWAILPLKRPTAAHPMHLAPFLITARPPPINSPSSLQTPQTPSQIRYQPSFWLPKERLCRGSVDVGHGTWTGRPRELALRRGHRLRSLPLCSGHFCSAQTPFTPTPSRPNGPTPISMELPNRLRRCCSRYAKSLIDKVVDTYLPNVLCPLGFRPPPAVPLALLPCPHAHFGGNVISLGKIGRPTLNLHSSR